MMQRWKCQASGVHGALYNWILNSSANVDIERRFVGGFYEQKQL